MRLVTGGSGFIGQHLVSAPIANSRKTRVSRSSASGSRACGCEFVADHVTRQPPSGTAEGVRIALQSTGLSIEKARRELGYAPRPIESALREIITHLVKAHAV